MEKNVKEVTIKIDGDVWADCLDKAYKKKNKNVKIDGFRKGTAPKNIYIKKMGIESLYMDAADLALQKAYEIVINEKKIIPVIEPTVDIKNINEKEIEILFGITTKPEVKLGEYTKLGIKKEKAKVTKKEIDDEIKHLQDQLAEIVVKDKGTIAKGDTAVIDFDGKVDGKSIDGGKGENYPLEIGSNTFIPGFEDGLIGLKTGDSKTLNLKFPEDYVANLKGKDVAFDVTVREIKTRKLPEINEEFFKDLGYDDMKTKEELEKEVEKTLVEKKQKEIDDKYYEECLDAAIKNMTVEIPKEIIDDEVHHMIHQFEERLATQGVNIEQYYKITGTDHQKLHEQMEGDARKRVNSRYLLEAVCEKEKIDFTDKEVKAKAKEMADNYGITVDEMLKAYGNMDAIKMDMKFHRALEIISEE